jgi:hypothetical protein
MRRFVPIAVALLAVTACRTYDRYPYVSSEKGLVPADQFAGYGPDEAIATAIGREYGRAHKGETPADYAAQAAAAIAYAKKFPQVTTVTVDTLGYRLAVKFKSGWTAQVTPIDDGKTGDETANLPKGN